MVSCPTSTCAILFSSRSCSNWLYGMVSTWVKRSHRDWTSITPEEGRKDVPGRKLVLALLRLLRRAASRLAFARPGARCLAISKQLQESPTRRGLFRILRRLIEHVGLRWRYVSHRRSTDPSPSTIRIVRVWSPTYHQAAWFEAYLGGHWYTIDAITTNCAPAGF